MFKFFICFVLSFITLSLIAQNKSQNLFETPSSNARKAAISLIKGEKRASKMTINTKLEGGSRLNNTPNLNLNLFDNIEIPVKFDPAQKTNYKGLEIYRGRSNDKKFAHLPHYRDVIMVYNPTSGNIVLQINNSTSFYEIKPTQLKGEYRVSEWSENSAICEKTAFYQESSAAIISGCEEKDANGKYVADLFVGYSYQAAAQAVDIDAHALSLVAMVNNGLSNSLVDNVYVRLVGTGIDSHNPGIVTSVLSDVYTWFADDIAKTSPDFVASIQVPTGAPNEMGGWAGVGGYSSVNSINSAAAIIRHEIGHNIGSSHCTAGIRPYAAGYNNGNSRTHMCGNSVNFYSTPLINDNLGLPLGDAATADNARVWRERAAEVSSNRKHSIKFDANDLGCQTNFQNSTYHIQNVNSGKFLGTFGSSSSSGTNLILADSSANTRWNIYHLGEKKYKIEMVQNTNRSIDVPGGSSSPGTRLIVWTFNNNNNQKFTLENLGTDQYQIKAFNSLCFQVENNTITNGSNVVQNPCTAMSSGTWKLIPVYSNKLNVSINTTDVSCFGSNTGSATAIVTGGTGNYTYNWGIPGTGNTINNLAPGNYSVTISDGITSLPFTFTIKQNDKFLVNLKTYSSDKNLNGSVKATVSGGTAPYTMQWSNGTIGDTTSLLAPGVHNFRITDQTNCTYVKEFFIACSDQYKPCNDGNPNTLGDAYDANCNCAGIPVVCTLGRENIAIGKTASQVSTYGSGVASRAVDGNRDGNYNNGSVAHTNSNAANDWWQVDLGQVTKISDAVIYNRLDCCQGQMDSIYMFISTNPFASDNINTTLATPGIKKIKLFGRKLSNVVINPDTIGRYLRIQNARYDATSLNIAEVEVYSCGTPLMTALTANPIETNNWELKGKIKRFGSNILQVYVEHGAGNFNTVDAIDLSDINLKDSVFIFKNVNIGLATSYQFRLKILTAEGIYYSNENSFTSNQNYCTPSLGSLVWFKTFNRMRYKGIEYSYPTSNAYNDRISTTLDSLQMNSIYSMEFRTPDAGWTNLSYKIYIDLNDDKLFTAYNELVGQAIPAGQWTRVSFKIPDTDLKIGVPLRMRLQGYESINSSSCYGAVGNFVDYTVVIKDSDCSVGGHISRLYFDQDGDGFGNPAQSIIGNCASNTGYVKNNKDFNDRDNSMYPNATDGCDNKDNDNDGQTDEDRVTVYQNISLSNQNLASGNQTASEKIRSEQNVNISSGIRLNFNAQKSIELLPGTTISSGAVFRASIQTGCGD